MPTGSLSSANPVNRLSQGTESHWLRAALEAAAMANGTWPLAQERSPARWTCFPRVATRTLTADARAVREARELPITTLHRWGTAQRCDDIALVLSELVTNALRHAVPIPGKVPGRRPIRVGLLLPGPCILCVVADHNPMPPVRRQPGCLAETGRGLHVIDALSDNWGHTALGDEGKSVWAVLTSTPTHVCSRTGSDGTRAISSQH